MIPHFYNILLGSGDVAYKKLHIPHDRLVADGDQKGSSATLSATSIKANTFLPLYESGGRWQMIPKDLLELAVYMVIYVYVGCTAYTGELWRIICHLPPARKKARK